MTHEQFTQIYLPFSGKMYALAYNLLRNRDEARDCVQDVYAELWNKRDTIEPDKPPLPFVLTMVRNNCLDRLKSRSAQADDETLETLLDHNTENQIEAASDLNGQATNKLFYGYAPLTDWRSNRYKNWPISVAKTFTPCYREQEKH